jgi:hypothetical protein
MLSHLAAAGDGQWAKLMVVALLLLLLLLLPAVLLPRR